MALAQSRMVAAALAEHGHEAELLELVTTGDRWSAEGRAAAADRGMFVKELEEALLDGRAHLAVHSAKDLPTELPPGLAVLAVPPREDPRDVLVGAPSLAALPSGARVGTGSPRRSAQLLLARPDLEVVPVRGNVDTRLGKLDRGEVDALVLAAAGLARLGIARPDAVPLDPAVSTPAPGQGLLAVEGRTDDAETAAAVAVLDDAGAAEALRAERALLAALGGGCMTPAGALCDPADGGLRLRMVAFRADDAAGAAGRRVTVAGPGGDPLSRAARAAAELGAG
ncbi:MAG: hydroxymethylbilane synthase [Thermoleophilia bacterium]|nr:hydroxymethylbilane synthase [Thermoleophilia bacterium]